LLDPEGKPEQTGEEVREQLFDYLDAIQEQGQDNPVSRQWRSYHTSIRKSCNKNENGYAIIESVSEHIRGP